MKQMNGGAWNKISLNNIQITWTRDFQTQLLCFWKKLHAAFTLADVQFEVIQLMASHSLVQ